MNPDRQPAPRVEVPTAPLPPLSAETLAGSQWVVNGKVVDLQPDGAVVADGEAAGSWSVEGDRFRVEAGGVTTTGTIHGQDIQPDEGSEISRLN